MRIHSLLIAAAAIVLGAASGVGATSLYELDHRSPTWDTASAGIVGASGELSIDLDPRALDAAPKQLDLVLPDGRRVLAEERRTTFERGAIHWSGTVELRRGGLPGYVFLSDRGDRVSGILNLGADRFQIVPTATGHSLVRVESLGSTCALDGLHGSDDEANPWLDEKSGVPVDDPQANPWIDGKARGSLPGDLGDARAVDATKAATSVIDVLAIYPAAFTGTAETGVRTFIQSSVAIANDIFANGGIDAQYNLVAMERLTGADQPPATGLFDGRAWMTPFAGSQDPETVGPAEMLALRDQYGADMVALFIPLSWDDDDACGVANLPEADGDIRFFGDVFGRRAYTVHRDGCGLNDLTFAHELGHNFGMRHNDFAESTSAAVHLFPNGRGHSPSVTPWQSIENGTVETNVQGNFTVGYHFTPSVDGYITGFSGFWNGNHAVKLWNFTTGEQLCDDPATSFDEPCLSIQSANTWVDSELAFVLPVSAGVRYTVGGHITQLGTVYSNIALFPRVVGDLTIHGSAVVAGNARPTATDVDNMFGAFDIHFVPETDLASTVMGCAALDRDDIVAGICNRIEYFSDPNRSVGGYAIGTSTRDNDQVARVQAPVYAAFRSNNGAPTCSNDSFSTTPGTSLTIFFHQLLANDTDPNGDTLFVDSYDATTSQGGSNSFGSPIGFSYTPPSPTFTGTDSFQYTASDGSATDTCTVTIQVTGAEQTIGEVGRVTNLTHTPRTVTFSRSYANPVVIAQTVSQNGADTSVVRITNVSSSGFTFFVDEAPDRDGPHTNETVAWIVLQAGSWQLADGREVAAGTRSVATTVGQLVANQWTVTGFGNTFPTTPLVFSQTQTNNDPSWVKTRQRLASTSGVQIALEEEEASATAHGTETVGWLAIEPGTGTWSGRAVRAGRTSATVTDAFTPVSFASTASPRLFAAMSTYNGGNNAGLRYQSLQASSVQIRVEEDTTLDAEVAHIGEAVDFLVIDGSGTLTASPLP